SLSYVPACLVDLGTPPSGPAGLGLGLGLGHYGDRGPARLAPFYDLVCTRAYPRLDRQLAMSIGGRRDPGQIGRVNWQHLATTVGVGSRLVLDEVERLATLMPAVFAEVAKAHRATYGESPAIQRLQRVIAKQCRCTLGLLRAASVKGTASERPSEIRTVRSGRPPAPA
ncbi:MAG: type II toxin-antitoxin system HipA family toxin, partial [Deltaproteobacteria bacterium]|nr:type II toxin-antitoxin system HipA family toxin [Deltaproteobacteria bacterium]